LAYLPPRKDEARWLVAAIEGEYGPPKAYREEKANQAKLKETTARQEVEALRAKARQSYQATQEGPYLAYLTSQLAQVENLSHEPLWPLPRQRRKSERSLPGPSRNTFPNLTSQREYLLRFAEFFAARQEANVLSFWDWDRQENKTPLNAEDDQCSTHGTLHLIQEPGLVSELPPA